MKIINQSFAIILAFSLTGSFVFAQGTSVFDKVTVSATIGQGTSSISIVEENIDFGGTLIPEDGNSRHLSGAITIDYFAANGPWEIRVYTENQNGVTGLLSTNSASVIPLKFATEGRNGEFQALVPVFDNDGNILTNSDGTNQEEIVDLDITDDLQWAGILPNGEINEDYLAFFRVLDKGTTDANEDPFYSIAASSKNENPNGDDEFQVKFGIDISGAESETHTAEVIFELAIL